MISPERTNMRSGEIIKESIVFYIKYFLIALLVVIAVLALSHLLNIELKTAASTKGLEGSSLFNKLLWITLIGPLIEEILFRLWLSFKREHIAVFSFLLTYVLLNKLLPHDHTVSIGSYQSVYFEHPVIKAVCSTVAACSIFLIKEGTISSFAKRYGKILIISSVLLFALVHLTNARCEWYAYPLALCMCLPQLILGISLTNLRLNIGYWAAVIFHSVVNILAVIPSIIEVISTIN